MTGARPLIHALGYLAAPLFLTGTVSAQTDDFAYDAVYQTVEVLIKATPPGAGQRAEVSRGWAISAPGQCFVVSTSHGVTVTDALGRYQGEMAEITITAPGRGSFAITRRADLRERFTSDLAVLTLPESDCPFTGDLIFDRHRGLRRRAGNGVDIEERDAAGDFDKESLAIYRLRLSPEDAIASPEGWSGASVMEGGRRIGMVFEVSDPRTFRFYSIRQIQRELDQIGLTAFVPSVEKQGFTVDVNGGAAYTSIQAAVDEATAGTVITVKPGLYREQVTITKDIQLIGETVAGKRPHIVWNESTALAVSTGQIVVDNFEVTGGRLWPSGVQGNPAIDVSYGSPTLRNLAVHSPTFHCVRIVLTEAARFEDSQVGPCAVSGFVINDGKAVGENLTISDFQMFGFLTRGDSVGTLRDSVVRDSSASGATAIGFAEEARGLVEKSRLENVEVGIATNGTSTPIIRGNTGHRFKVTIGAGEQSRPVIEDNVFTEAAIDRTVPAVFVHGESEPVIRNNVFGGVRSNLIVLAPARQRREILDSNTFERAK